MTLTKEERAQLRESLILHEGLRTHPYTDTAGKLTIGVGRNLTDNGISQREAFDLLDHDIDDVIADVQKALPWAGALDPVRRLVLLEMCFNLGITTLLKFPKTLAAMQRGEYDQAADQMLESLWSRQVGARAFRLAQRMREGTVLV